MKSSLKKLREFALHRGDQHKEVKRRDAPHMPVSPHEELLQAAQEMQDMKGSYDSLLSAAAATANSAYEFSEALREMGTCLLEKIALNNDDQYGKVLEMIGKTQLHLQRLVDNYRVHVIQTITTPSESLIKELEIVEEMKQQCDDKRDLYKFMQTAQKDNNNNKGRSNYKQNKGGERENFTDDQIKQAQEDYNEEATLFVFRLKSLKQGQFRSLLTQATRHHAAQLNFFRKGTKKLEAVEPDVISAAEAQRIDYLFAELDDDFIYDDDDVSYDDEYRRARDDDVSELSFGYAHSQNKLDSEQNENHNQVEPFSFNGSTNRPVSQSEPLTPNKLPDQSERIKAIMQRSPSVKKNPNSYVLPTPNEENTQPQPHRVSLSKTGPLSPPRPLWFSSPLRPNPNPKNPKSNENFALPTPPKFPLKENNIVNPRNKIRKTRISSELHELPRPPPVQSSPLLLVPHSAPLTQDKDKIKDFKERKGVNVILQGMSKNVPSPLPTPPVQRSYSIPSSANRREVEGIDAKLAEGFKEKNLRREKEAAKSPPMKPMALKSARNSSADSDAPF